MWTYNNELYHYGVLGMKWGVRKDSRASRYSRGKELSKERATVATNRTKRLNQQSKMHELAEKARNIANKYGLDGDDGGGGDTSRYSKATLRKAGKQYMDLWDQYEYIAENNRVLGRQYANEYMTKKYGNTAISDIDYYHKHHGRRWLVGSLAAIGGLIYIGTRD